MLKMRHHSTTHWNVWGINELHELSKLFKAHLSMLRPIVTIMLGKILTGRDNRSLKKGRKRKKGEKRERA